MKLSWTQNRTKGKLLSHGLTFVTPMALPNITSSNLPFIGITSQNPCVLSFVTTINSVHVSKQKVGHHQLSILISACSRLRFIMHLFSCVFQLLLDLLKHRCQFIGGTSSKTRPLCFMNRRLPMTYRLCRL